MTNTITMMPTWTPERPADSRGHLTGEGWALEDSMRVNERIRHLGELREAAGRVAATGRSGRLVITLDRSVARLEETLRRNATHCTNSGLPRTACDTCDHTRQLALLDARV